MEISPRATESACFERHPDIRLGEPNQIDKEALGCSFTERCRRWWLNLKLETFPENRLTTLKDDSK